MTEEEKQSRKWYTRLFFFLLKCLAALVALGIVVYLAIAGFNTYKEYKKNEEFNEQALFDPFQSMDALETYLRESDEVIYDMPVDEALDLGIDPLSFDTSGNGLSDEDALDYGADPSKFSTADDGISDMVKVLEGYDPAEKIEFNEELELSFEEYNVTLKTDNLNHKYFSYIESYDMPKAVNNFESVIDPFQIKDYEGQVEVEIPEEKMDDSLEAYQFNFDTLEMEKIKNQSFTNNVVSFSIDNPYPIFFLNDENKKVMDDFGTYYYFRVSVPFIERIAGFNHKVVIFKKTLFSSSISHREIIEDDVLGIADYEFYTMKAFFTFLLERIFMMLDALFDHDVNKDSFLSKGGIIDYGKVEGTLKDAKLIAMPWLDENLREYFVENDDERDIEEEENLPPLEHDGVVLADSGFDMRVNAYRFSNVSTVMSEDGICAGYAGFTEKNFNKDEIPNKQTVKYSAALGRVAKWLGIEPKEVSYDIEKYTDDFQFLSTKNQYSYTMHDDATKGLTDGDPKTSYEKPLDVDELSNPDQSLFEMLQTYYVETNNDQVKVKHLLYDANHANIIEDVIDIIDSGEIVTVSLSGGPGSHGVNAYRVEQDEYNPDKLYIYLYDNNFPYEKIVDLTGKQEVRMEITREKRKTLFGSEPDFYNYFEFEFKPIENNDSYVWSSKNGDKVRFFKDGSAIKK